MTKHPVEPGITRLAVTGDVQTATSAALRELILNALDANDLHEIVIDIGAVPLLDSAGIAALIAGRNTAAARGIGYQIINYQHLIHRDSQTTNVPTFGADPATATPTRSHHESPRRSHPPRHTPP
ncbi:STAS domain-containing protein [Actinoplanes sp. NPDC026623]|uniref:STAS domain-containing protein n=1 Tax=Actinoplanes sp. NPDC026623 TaxID=3155610 RepID=UPI0033DE5C00